MRERDSVGISSPASPTSSLSNIYYRPTLYSSSSLVILNLRFILFCCKSHYFFRFCQIRTEVLVLVSFILHSLPSQDLTSHSIVVVVLSKCQGNCKFFLNKFLTMTLRTSNLHHTLQWSYPYVISRVFHHLQISWQCSSGYCLCQRTSRNSLPYYYYYIPYLG